MSAPDIVGPGGSPRNVGNAEFLEGVVGPDWRSAWVLGFDGPPGPGSPWGSGRPWQDWTSEQLAKLADQNAYFCISLLKPGPGNHRRREDFVSCHTIVLDDVGRKVDARDVLMTLGDPSWRLETSPGSEHWGYILETPETNPDRVDALLAGLKAKRLTDAGTLGAVRVMRLPCGMNLKTEIMSAVILREWEPTRKFEIAELLRNAGVSSAFDPGTGPGTALVKAASPPRQADRIIQTLWAWGDLTGTKTNDGGWHLVACPWDHEHTPGAKVDDRTAVYPGGGFKCWHGHCADRHRKEFLVWFNQKLSDESGGLFSHVAQLELDRVDPASIAVSPVPVPSPASTTKSPPPAASAAERAILDEMIWIRDQGKFFSRTTQTLETQKSVDFHWSGPLGRAKVSDWLGRQPGRVSVNSLVYWPGGGEIVVLGAARCANRWRPCALGRALAAEADIPNWMVRPWLNLVWHVLGSEGGRFVARVLDWMALVVGDPGVKPGWHLIVQGGQGIGKDLMMFPVVSAVGAGNVGSVTAAGLHRDFNPYAEKRLILVSELKQTTVGSASGRDQYNTLKALTENTSTTIPINQKNMKEYQARNVGAYYVTSNEPDALALDNDDRRFVVASSTAAQWDEARYVRLVAWLGGGTGAGVEAVAAWLLQRWDRMPAYRRVRLLGKAFDTQSKREMVVAADPVRAWTREQIEDGTWPDLMTSGDLDQRYRDAVRNRVFRFAVPAQRWGRLLRELGGEKVYGGAPVRLPDGRNVRVWAVREPGRFKDMGEPQIAQAYRSAAAHAFGPNADVVDFPKT